MATNPGDSGGPVVNDKCELVGVNSWISLKEQNVNAAVDIREVRRFVEDYFTSIGSKWRDIVPAPSTQEAADVLTLVGHLESGDKSTKIKAMVALSEMGSQARLGVNSLLKLLNGSDADLRNVAAVTLEKIGKLTAAEVPVLRQALSTGNLESRRYASAMLARLGPDAEPALADLIQSLEDADSQVRKNSLRAIQQIGSAARTAFVPVLKRLDDEDRGIAQLAAEVLRAYGNPTKQDIPALKRMFTSSRLRTRVQVAALLLRLGDTENVGTLVDALSDKDEALREFALKAIAALKSAELVNCWPKLLPGLRQALANRDRHVKLSAIRILEKGRSGKGR
ncbi:MAG: hypothetical protein KatS3mg105_3571 [Gemmatales bacterium]|nr:MAG: hypothetical protein KatS3mg105_3571 [Gemmatales bacterium]